MWPRHRDPEVSESQQEDLLQNLLKGEKDTKDWHVISQAVEAERIMGQRANGT